LPLLRPSARLRRVAGSHTNSLGLHEGGRPAGWLQSASAQVWLRFLMALVGLGLAFGTALLSTVAGEAGNLWASVALASFALILAALVGLVTVPYLARRVALERLRESIRYDVTKAGVIYVVATLVIGIAALNTGNNLLYIVVAAMLAAILVSGVVSAIVLRNLKLDVRLPEHVFAARPAMARVVVRNPRRLLPAFSIRVVPASKESKKNARKQWKWEPTTFAFPLNRPAERQWLRLRDWRVKRVALPSTPPGIFDSMIYFPYLPAKTESQADLRLLFAHRGCYRESSFGLATQFPFAFLTKTRDVALEGQIVVYPPVDPTEEMLAILPAVLGEWESFVRGRGSDLYRIREYMPEDSARHVDWKSTAKSGSLKVREFARDDGRKLCIVFDNPIAGALSEASYERAVNLAASVAWYFSSWNADVSFLIPGRDRTADVHEFLAQLAMVQPEQNSQCALDDVIFEMQGQYNIVITMRPPKRSAEESRSHFLLVRD
jgi:uncharacterized protein (DUF58 family)